MTSTDLHALPQTNLSPTETYRPTPRSGWKGQLDRLIGPGATSAELAIQFIPSAIAAIAASLYATTLPSHWSPLQLVLIAILGFDLAGGVLTNATAAAKRWYHRPGQSWRQHLSFAVLHLIHIGLVSLFFRGADWGFFVGVAGYLLLAANLILLSPLYLQRPIALGLYSLALVGDRYLFTPTPGLEWFLSLFFLKLLISHLLNETAYQPNEHR